MDQETLTNHISNLGKVYFEKACKIVLEDSFNIRAINVDGSWDGGTDFSSYSSEGDRIKHAYQITTQKTAIKKKAYFDAKKAIEKLGITKFYFFSTYNLTEIEVTKIQELISSELGISAICIPSRIIAGLMLSDNLLNKFLDEANYPLPREATLNYDYREMALHSYTILSDDANQMKSDIYDDTILFVLSTSKALTEDLLVQKTIEFLGLNDQKTEVFQRRIGALFGKSKIKRNEDGTIELHPKSIEELNARKKIYEIELSNLSAAQVDLLRTEYDTDWTDEDSKKVAIWIANASISDQLANLKEAKASIIANPLFNVEKNGIDNLRNFLKNEKKIESKFIDHLIQKLLHNAAGHPLITKIARASIYIALEGSNPISSAKALGGNRWSDFNILVEPTVAIPYTCAQLYQGKVNRYFDLSIKAVEQAKKLGASLFIPFFYINECAGHLLHARKYNNIQLNEEELVYSNNAFVANYYALKLQGLKLPTNFMDYLSSFSPAIKTERENVKEWVRAIMTDIQSILTRAHIEFINVPMYNEDDCKDFEMEYTFHLKEMELEKKKHLVKHDVFALQFTNDRIIHENQHWIILTYDRSMITITKNGKYRGWIANPIKFLDLTESTKPLSESHLVSVVHSVAAFSERSLAAGARIIDRVVQFAAPAMQNWEFKQEIEKFKKETITNINLDKTDFINEIDKKTDDFLLKHGVILKETEEDTDI